MTPAHPYLSRHPPAEALPLCLEVGRVVPNPPFADRQSNLDRLPILYRCLVCIPNR